jgi:hypothetical protein
MLVVIVRAGYHNPELVVEYVWILLSNVAVGRSGGIRTRKERNFDTWPLLARWHLLIGRPLLARRLLMFGMVGVVLIVGRGQDDVLDMFPLLVGYLAPAHFRVLR